MNASFDSITLQPSFGLGAMQKGSSVGRSVGAGKKDLSADGESDWLEKGEERRGKLKDPLPPTPLGRGPSEITLDGTTHVRYGPGINHNVYGCKSEPSLLRY